MASVTMDEINDASMEWNGFVKKMTFITLQVLYILQWDFQISFLQTTTEQDILGQKSEEKHSKNIKNFKILISKQNWF